MHFVRRVACLILVALGLAAWSAAAASASTADMGFMVGGPLPQPLPSTSSGWFPTLMTGAPMHYQRIGVAWDQFGNSNNRSRCVSPTRTNSYATTFTNDVAQAEQLGQMPLVVIGPDIWGATSGYQWPSGAQPPAPQQNGTPTPPSDREYKCGVQLLLKTLNLNGLARTGMPVEAFNEPDNTSYPVPAQQAASYFGDLVAVGGSQVHAIAGVFESPYDETYATGYVNALKASRYNSSAMSWSVHDFNDVNASQSCSPTNPTGCSSAGVTEFHNWLMSQGEPTTDVWITEAGDPGVWVSGGHTRTEEANSAYGWWQLHLNSDVQHMFWYQWQTVSPDGWDSALVNLGGQPRPSYCVIAYHETPATALADPNCPGS